MTAMNLQFDLILDDKKCIAAAARAWESWEGDWVAWAILCGELRTTIKATFPRYPVEEINMYEIIKYYAERNKWLSEEQTTLG